MQHLTFLDMLGVFAEFETNLRKERQLDGIAKAKAEGIYTGRKASIDAKQVRTLKAEGAGGQARLPSALVLDGRAYTASLMLQKPARRL
jgi:DNA invertase Pin-like site-specific DNA recombinase